MTREAAYAKLVFLLSNVKDKKIMQQLLGVAIDFYHVFRSDTQETVESRYFSYDYPFCPIY